MPVKIQNSFSPYTPVGEALNNAITSYANSIPTYGEVQESRVNANKADAPQSIEDSLKALFSGAGPGKQLTPQMVQDSLPAIAKSLQMGGDIGQVGSLMRTAIYNAANPESVAMKDNAALGAGGNYNATETGFGISEANDLKKTQMQESAANYRTGLQNSAAADRTKMVIDAAAARMAARPNMAGAPGPSGAPAKPLPIGALRLQQDALDALGTANSIAADIGKTKETIDEGDLDLGLLTNAGSAARNYFGLSSENSRNYATFKATLEKMRNDSLRLNAGVQTEGDAIRAWNELLANISDSTLVSQRLEEIQSINNRAAELRKANVATIRENYGLDPLDMSAYEQEPAIFRSGGAPANPSANGFTIKRVR